MGWYTYNNIYTLFLLTSTLSVTTYRFTTFSSSLSMMLIVYYSHPLPLLCIPSSHPIISHTGSVLSTNPPHLSPHLSISSLNHIPTTISYIWHVFPLYSSSFCVCVAIDKLPPVATLCVYHMHLHHSIRPAIN